MVAVTGELAHIVYPSSKLVEVTRGEKQRVKSLCGTFVKRKSKPSENVCRKCFNLYNDGRFNGGTNGGQ